MHIAAQAVVSCSIPGIPVGLLRLGLALLHLALP